MAFLGGYRVNSQINFESNGVAVMQALAKSVTAAQVTIDANTKAIMLNARAVKALATEMRAAIAAISDGTNNMRSHTAAVDSVTAAYDRAAAAVSRFNAGALGAASFAAGAARVVSSGGGMPRITRSDAGALGAGAFGTRYYSSAWGSSQRALPSWKDGPLAASYEPPNNWRYSTPPPRGPGTPWGTGENYRNLNQIMPYAAPPFNAGRAFGMGQSPFGKGPSGGGVMDAVGGVMSMLSGPIGVVGRVVSTFNPLKHMVESLGIADAVTEAARLQGIMQSIYNITGTTNNPQAQARLRNLMFETGNQFAMSPIQSASMFREISRQSQGTMPEAQMEQMLPYIARMQIVLSQTRGMGAQETTDAAMNFVHLLRLYKPEQMGGPHGGFDLMTRLMEMAPVDPQQLVRQMTYVAPEFLNLGIPNEQLAAIMLSLTRSGYGTGKGATGIAQLVAQSLGVPQITSFSTAIKQGYLGNAALNVLGKNGIPTWINKQTGKADAIMLLQSLATFEQKDIAKHGGYASLGKTAAERTKTIGKMDSEKVFRAVYGVQGGRMAEMFSDPMIMKVLQGSLDAMRQPSLGLTEQSNKYLNLTTTRIQRGWQNFQALMTEIGWITLPAVSKAFNDLANTLHKAQSWLNSHKAETQAWSKGLVTALNILEVAAQTVIYPMLAIARVFGDITTGKWGDIGSAMGEYTSSQRAGREMKIVGNLPTHAARVAELQRYRMMYGDAGLDPSLLRFLPALPKTAPSAAPSPGDFRSAQRAIVNGGIHITIQGADKNKKEIVDEMMDAFGDIFNTPRPLQRASSTSRTHPNLPSTLTKATGTSGPGGW